MNSLGERMKSYEEDDRLPKGTVIIRVDGKAFHTWVKQVKAMKPFDVEIAWSMMDAARNTADVMQGCKLMYTQSDEATFCLYNPGENEQGWFDYKVQKLASLTASYFTHFFNEAIELHRENDWHYRPLQPAFFDARAYSVPVEDAANNFVWRQQDWLRNSVQMLGRAHLSHKEMQGLSREEVLDKLCSFGVEWEALADWQKYGVFTARNPETSMFYNIAKQLNYQEINNLLGIDSSEEG